MRQDWTVEEYHAHPAVSSGGLRTFRTDGPLAYYQKYVERKDTGEEKDWQRLGTAFHLAMEDMEAFHDSFRIIPDLIPDSYQDGPQTDAEKKRSAKEMAYFPDGSTGMPIDAKFKRHAAYLAEIRAEAEAQGKSWLTTSEYEAKMAQVRAVWDNPAARPFLGSHTIGNREVPFLVEDDETGLEKKALADVIVGDTLVDYKTTRHRTPEEFIRDAVGYPVVRDGELKYWKAGKGYGHQLAHYLEVTGLKRAVIISVCTDAPYESMVYEIDQSIIDLARQMNHSTLRSIAACHRHDSWHTLGWGEVVTIGGTEEEGWE